MKDLKTASHKGTRKHWVVKPRLLGPLPVVDSPPLPVANPTRPPVADPPPSIAALTARASSEWAKLQSNTPLPDSKEKKKGRTPNFVLSPDSPTLTAFKKLGFESWLRRVKKDASVTSTLNQLGDFVAWWKHTRHTK
jgi:hypothetical protein